MPSRNTLRAVFGAVFYAAVLFGSAGTLAWLEGWIFYGWNLVAMTVTGVWLQRTDPVLFAERSKPPFQKGQPWWDRLILIFFVLSWFGWFVLPGLDAVRFGWSRVDLGWKILGGVLHVAAWFGIVWVVKSNTFLIPIVRVQTEREHRVIDTGPYAIVRHPMYAVIFVWLPAGSLLLGSWWATLGCLYPIALLTLRTALEDRLLQRELPGYAEYAARVRFRLVPGVW